MDELLTRSLTEAWSNPLPLALLGRILLAALLGGIVGLERELSGKPAGLRTNLLICLGAALLTELSVGIAVSANERNEIAGVVFRADPGRIAAQIVTGIGFLGAGTILQSRGNVVGLTTAATIWVVAAIGMAVGAGAYLIALGTTGLVVVTLALLGRLEEVVVRRRQHQRFLVRIPPDAQLLTAIDEIVRGSGLRIGSESVERGEDAFEISFDLNGRAAALRLLFEVLIANPRVSRVTRA